MLHPALVLGGGIVGRMAARALLNIGVPVTLLEGPDQADSLTCAGPGFNEQAFLEHLRETTRDAVVVEVSAWPHVRRDGHLFRARIAEDGEETFGCVFVCPGVPLAMHDESLPPMVETISPAAVAGMPERIAFLLDCPRPSSPGAGMLAFRQALENTLAGGTSFVVFRQAPVIHVFGETLYEDAKVAGVRFHRFGGTLPVVESLNGAAEASGPFRVTVRDVIEEGEQIVFECDRVVAATQIDASSLPARASAAADGDCDSEGFLLSESIHCHSGRSFRKGIYALGGATGSPDLLQTLARASAAAVDARAWMLWAASQADAHTMDIGLDCCRCLTCTRICPHAAISIEGGVARSVVQVSGPLCQECGVCVSECPQRVLDLHRMPESDIAAFLKDVEARQGEKPLVVYGCQRSGGKLAAGMELPAAVVPFSVPCAGRISETVLWATLAAGAAGVLVVGCHHGNCRSDTGTDWAGARVARLLETLGFSLESSDAPMAFATVAPNEPARFARLLKEFAASRAEGTSRGNWFRKTG